MKTKNIVHFAGYEICSGIWFVVRFGTDLADARRRLEKAVAVDSMQFEIKVSKYVERSLEVYPGEELYEIFFGGSNETLLAGNC